MPLRKLSDWYQKICTSPSHNPPSHRVYESGVYEWTCPACGNKQIFTVRNPILHI